MRHSRVCKQGSGLGHYDFFGRARVACLVALVSFGLSCLECFLKRELWAFELWGFRVFRVLSG